MAIHDWGVNIKLESTEAVQRGAELAQEYPHKYECSNYTPNGRTTADWWFYFIALGAEVDEIANWVMYGAGNKPNGVRAI